MGPLFRQLTSVANVWLSAELAIVEGYMDIKETAAKPELTSRLFFSRTAMSKEPVQVGRGWREKVGLISLCAFRFSLFARALSR
jgi:hypothetical protein